MGSLSKRLRRIKYLAGKLEKHRGEEALAIAVSALEDRLESIMYDEGFTLVSNDDDCPESNPDCIPSDPPPKIP